MATYGQYYNDIYLKTHQQRLADSINFAQTEYKMLNDRIMFYEKLKADYAEGVRKAKADIEKGMYVSAADETARLSLIQRDTQDVAQNKEDLRKQAQGQFDVTRYDIPSLRDSMEAKFLAGQTQTQVIKDAVDSLGGRGIGTSNLNRIALVQAVSSAAENAAISAGKSGTFNRANAISQLTTYYSVPPADMAKDRNDLIDEYVTQLERQPMNIPQLRAGTQVRAPSQTQATTAYTAEEQAILDQYDEKIKDAKDKFAAKYGKEISEVDIEDIIVRGRDIYSSQFAPLNKQQRQALKEKRVMDNLSSKGQRNMAAYNSVQANDYRLKLMDNDISAGNTPEAYAKKIVELKRQGLEEFDAYQTALELAGDDENKANEILGLAIRYTQANAPKAPIDKVNAVLNPPIKTKPTSDKAEAMVESVMEQFSPEATPNLYYDNVALPMFVNEDLAPLEKLFEERLKIKNKKPVPQGEDLTGLPPISGQAPVIKTEDEISPDQPRIPRTPVYKFQGMEYQVTPIKDAQGITTGYNLYSSSTGDIQKIDKAEYAAQGKGNIVDDLDRMMQLYQGQQVE